MKYSSKEIFTTSNFVSLLRILLFFPIYFTLQRIEIDSIYRIYSVLLFILAFITDILDGFIARKFNQISEVGKIIDPLADKILVALIIIQLYLQSEITTEYFIIILLRDLIIFLGGIYVSKRLHYVLPSNVVGKITVFLIASYLLVTVLNGVYNLTFIRKIFYYLGIIMSFVSVIVYSNRAIVVLKIEKK